ncbi:Endonuclease/exonuclease/phosphatase [Choanephora cucurbitarum]|nr:Endonuclease/exonuclease/phosphatase [Choanephora cucurbitarum]
MRPPGIKNNGNDYKNSRLEYIIHNILPSYDIITIQEALHSLIDGIDQLRIAAFEQGFHYQSDIIEFPRGVHSDWLSYKGALHALVQLNETSIHVYTTHTQASYDNGGKLNFDDTKAKNDNHSILLMGDLNVDAAVHDGSPIDTASVNSSLPYTMMMDVLKGKGTDLNLITNTSSNQKQIQYESTWLLTNLTDVVYSTFGYHPVTFGDYHRLNNGTLIPSETILTSHNQLLTVQSIDRILWSGNRDNNTTSIRPCNVTIEPFFVDKSLLLPFTQVSDHYGLSASLCRN